jgi:Cu(I)/Ag(I) efflux system membrane fusion protein
LIKSQVELFETETQSIPDEAVRRGAEEKLIQQGLTRDQIENIKKQKKSDLYVTLRAPIGGTVTKKMAFLGQFVKEGQEMYMINDLSSVWVKMDAYETDIPWIRYGQEVTFTTPALPGRSFKGKVLFIDPMLDMRTRSVKVRVEAANPNLSLKPGMFVTAELEAETDAAGRVIKSEWIGKYICPIHPSDQPSSEPGVCPESNMPLRPAASFGYADEKDPALPLVIPASAPLITGKRAVVYVEVPGRDRPTYELREVVLGPRAGDEYVVYKGLKEGERVVSKGNFKIDSAMQILARSSMMQPGETKAAREREEKAEEEVIEKIPVSAEFLKGLNPLIQHYLELKDALVSEKTGEASALAGRMEDLLGEVKQETLDGKAGQVWKQLSVTATDNLKRIQAAKDVDAMRKAFDPLSECFVRMLMTFRHVMDKVLFVYHCPMALDKRGAYWIDASPAEEKRNPYFGERHSKGQDMLRCGELVEKIPPEKVDKAAVAGKAGSGPDAKSGETGHTSQPHRPEGGK